MNKISILLITCFLTLNLYAQETNKSKEIKPFYQGKVIEVRHGGGYTYLNVTETNKKSFWAVVSKTDVKKGDIVRFQKQLIAKNFESKALNRKFDEIMFADNLQHKINK
jgi:hypothetical protein